MSLMLTLTEKNTVLAINYFPPIELSDNDYELGLINFETYYTIRNVNALNNKFYFGDDVEITIPRTTGYKQIVESRNFTKTSTTRDSFR